MTRRIYTPRGLALTEDTHTVFREAVPPGVASGIPVTEAPPPGMLWSRTIVPDPVTLFRYSALTFNPHRIHYDKPYAMEREGYPGLVVHGPFTQQCLLDLLRDNTDYVRSRRLACGRGRRCSMWRRSRWSGGCLEADQAELFAVTPEGGIAIQARARLG